MFPFQELCPPGGAGPPLIPLVRAEDCMAVEQSSFPSFPFLHADVSLTKGTQVVESDLPQKVVSLSLKRRRD